jgi:hypothetical protein
MHGYTAYCSKKSFNILIDVQNLIVVMVQKAKGNCANLYWMRENILRNPKNYCTSPKSHTSCDQT